MSTARKEVRDEKDWGVPDRRVNSRMQSGGGSWNDLYAAIESNYERWADDAEKLYQLGPQLLQQTPSVELRIPRSVADAAVAATFSLIGQSIEETGMEDGDQVIFKLDAWILGNALEAADKAGRMGDLP